MTVRQVREIFHENKQRFTKSRNVLIEIFLKEPNRHFTIDELVTILKNDDETNLTTLYNNLAVFVELDLVEEFNFNNRKHFELSQPLHGHFVCVKCGDIFNVDVPGLACLRMEIKSKYNAQVFANTLEFKGCCEKCIKDENDS